MHRHTTETTKTPQTTTTIYTDGSCLGNPGPGGWAAIILSDNDGLPTVPREISGGAVSTTNNRMEMTAAIEAIKAASPITTAVTVISDSKYVIDGICGWINGWKKNNWKTAGKKPVKNQDLWEELDALNSPLITWSWVKGHSGNRWNEVADTLANTAATQHSAQPRSAL